MAEVNRRRLLDMAEVNRRRLLDMAVFLTWSLSSGIRRIIMIIATIIIMIIIIIITMQAGIRNILTLETS